MADVGTGAGTSSRTYAVLAASTGGDQTNPESGPSVRQVSEAVQRQLSNSGQLCSRESAISMGVATSPTEEPEPQPYPEVASLQDDVARSRLDDMLESGTRLGDQAPGDESGVASEDGDRGSRSHAVPLIVDTQPSCSSAHLSARPGDMSTEDKVSGHS